MKQYSLEQIRSAIFMSALFSADYVDLKCLVIIDARGHALEMSSNTGTIRANIAMLEHVLASQKKLLAEEGEEPTPATNRSVQ